MNSDVNDQEEEFDIEDLDDDFDTFEDSNSGRSQNPLVKLGIIGGIIVVVIVGILFFGGSGEPTNPSYVPTGQEDLREDAGTSELNPAMREQIEQENQDRLNQAIDTEESFFPTPLDPVEDRLSAEILEHETEDPLDHWRQIQEERLAQQPVQPAQPVQQGPDPVEVARQQALNDLAQAMSAQMGEILQTRSIQPLNSMVVTSFEDEQAAFGQQQGFGLDGAQGGLQNGQQGIAPVQEVTQLLSAGTVEYGQMLLEANSDIPGPVLAQIVTGPFSGGRVLGSFDREDRYLVIKFNTVVYEGVSYNIDAIAVDPDTTLTGMATDVDRRLFERIILPAAARFIEGLGEAVADSGDTTVVVSGETVVQDENDLDVREEVYSGVEEAARELGEFLEEEGRTREILVRVRAGTPLGILFLQPVFDTDANTGVQAQNSVQSPQFPNQQINPYQLNPNGTTPAVPVNGQGLTIPQGTGSININLGQPGQANSFTTGQ